MDNRIMEEYESISKELSKMPFDKALPILEKRLLEIGLRYNKSGTELFEKYIEWTIGREPQ